MNLREDKHWSYGAFTFFRDARGQRPFVVYAPVQTDKTKEAVTEVQKELRGILTDRPPTPEELSRAISGLTLTLPGNWETMGAVSGSIQDMVVFGLDDRYYDTYADRVRAQTIESVSAAAKETIRPDNLVWVVVGDRDQDRARSQRSQARRDPPHRRRRQADRRGVIDAAGRWSLLILAALAVTTSDATAQRRSRRGASWPDRSSSAFAAGATSGITSWTLGGQVRLPIKQNLELRPSGDLLFPEDAGSGWQLNADAAIRFGSGDVYAGGGAAWLHPDGGDTDTGYNLFFGITPRQSHSSRSWSFAGPSSTTRAHSGSCSDSVCRFNRGDPSCPPVPPAPCGRECSAPAGDTSPRARRPLKATTRSRPGSRVPRAPIPRS